MPSSKRLRASDRTTCVISSGCRSADSRHVAAASHRTAGLGNPLVGVPAAREGKLVRAVLRRTEFVLSGGCVARLAGFTAGYRRSFCGHFFCCGRSFLARCKIQNHVMCWNAFRWCLRLPEERSGGEKARPNNIWFKALEGIAFV